MNLINLDLPFLCLILHLIIPSLQYFVHYNRTHFPAAMFSITESPTATGTFLADTQQNLSHQETAV